MKKDEAKKLREAIARELDTRDKRFMFLKCMFSRNIDLSRENVAWNIFEEFEKQSMLGSLTASMNLTFDLNLTLTI